MRPKQLAERSVHDETAFRVRLLGVLMLVAVLVCACGDRTKAIIDPPQQVDAEFPRTIDADGRSVTIGRRPDRIAVLSPGSGEIAYRLVEPSRIIAASSTLENELISNVAAFARETPIKLPPGFQMDPEQVLALDPDLVVEEPAHEAERDTRDILDKAGVPVIELRRWSTIEDIRQNFFTMGRALGAEERAAEIVAQMDARLAAVRGPVKMVSQRPVVLPLLGFANPLITGPGTLTHQLIVEAGGINAADLMHGGPWDQADVEKILAANPDYIMLVDFQGAGRSAFSSVLDHPAMRAVNAVRKDNIRVFPGRITLSVGTDHVIDGLEEVARWIHPELFATTQGLQREDAQ